MFGGLPVETLTCLIGNNLYEAVRGKGILREGILQGILKDPYTGLLGMPMSGDC